jgi:hypothetical protein
MRLVFPAAEKYDKFVPLDVTTQEEIETLPTRWIRMVLWPANFREAVFATIFAIIVLSVGFLNPWAIPIWTLFTGKYNPSMWGIYVLCLQIAAIPFGINLVIFSCGKYLRSAIVLPQLGGCYY